MGGDAGGWPAPRVLVVDDEDAIRELLEMALRYDGWCVHGAATGAEALAAAAAFPPDVVVLDRMLPDVDGLEVLARLRTVLPRVPVLFLTARDAAADRAAALAGGADDYVTKPFGLADVDTRLRRLVAGRGRPVPDPAPGASA